MSTKYIDKKITIWERFHLEDKTDMSKIIELVKQDMELTEEDGFIGSELLLDSAEQMEIEENDNLSTIEIYDNTEIIYQNGEY